MSDEKLVIVEKLEPIPDFEGMSILQLIQYAHDLQEQEKGFGSGERLDKWMNAFLDNVPFYGLNETVGYLETQVDDLTHKFEKLLNFLERQLGPVEVNLKEWIKR